MFRRLRLISAALYVHRYGARGIRLNQCSFRLNQCIIRLISAALYVHRHGARGIRLKPSGNIITEGNISPNTPSGGSINVILYRKTKMFMQNLKHKRVHTLLIVLTHDIL